MDNSTDGFDWASHAWSEAVLDLIKSVSLPTVDGETPNQVIDSLLNVLTTDELRKDYPDQPTWLNAKPVPQHFLVRVLAYLLDGENVTEEDTKDTTLIHKLLSSALKPRESKYASDFSVVCVRSILEGFEKPDELDWREFQNGRLLESFLANKNLSSRKLAAVWEDIKGLDEADFPYQGRIYGSIATHPNTSAATLTEIYQVGMNSLRERVSKRGWNSEKDMPRGESQELLRHRWLIAGALSNRNFPRGVYEEDRKWLLTSRESRRRSWVTDSTAHLLLPWYATEKEVLTAWSFIAGSEPFTSANAAHVLDVAETYSVRAVKSVASKFPSNEFAKEEKPSSEEEVLRWVEGTTNGVTFWEPPSFVGTYSDETWVAVFNRLNEVGRTSHSVMQNRILIQVCNRASTPDWFKMLVGSGGHFTSFTSGWVAYRGGAEAYAERLGYANVPLEWVAEMVSPAGIE